MLRHIGTSGVQDKRSHLHLYNVMFFQYVYFRLRKAYCLRKSGEK